MSTHATLIDELESGLAHREIGHRAKVLQRITELFVTNSSQLSGEQIVLFDDVMTRLANCSTPTGSASHASATSNVKLAFRYLGIEVDDALAIAEQVDV